MAAFQKFNDFVHQLGLGSHNLNTNALKLALSNTLPLATHSTLADITEIAAGNGYPAGGVTIANTAWADVSGVGTLTGDDYTLVASGGSIGPFQYGILYNDTSPSDFLIGWWDRGSALTVEDGGQVLLDFTDGSQRILTIT